MRAALGWLLAVCGLAFAAAGFGEAAIAWWYQPHSPAEIVPSAMSIPSGFSARLSVPRLDRALYVVDMKVPRDLLRGPGYIGTSRPGEPGNCIIAGHRDLHFRFLKDIKVGDEIDISTVQDQFRYRVASTEILSAQDRHTLRAKYQQQLTLVTCFPFYYIGPAPRRFIVKAYRVQESQIR